MAFAWEIEVTIDHTKVGGSLTNFPILVDITSDDLKTTGNGGLVESASGHDIVFFASTGGVGKLDWEPLFQYNGAVGRVRTFLKIPALTNSAGQKYFIRVGDPGISTFQGNGPAVWSNGFVAVYHLAHDGITLDVNDATGNYNATNSGVVVNTANPLIYGGGSFDGTDDAIFGPSPIANSAIFAEAITVSAWVRRTAGTRRSIIGRYPLSGNSQWQLDMSQNANGNLSGGILNPDGSTFYSAQASNSTYVPFNTWAYVGMSWGKASDSGLLRLYSNGATYGTTPTYTGDMRSSTGRWALGQKESLSTDLFQGDMVEARLAASRRSLEWWSTEYQNMVGPVAFQTAGTPVPIPPSSSRRVMVIN